VTCAWTPVLARVQDAILAARDELNQLDAAAGDGDLGVTMTAAAQGATALAERGDLDGKTAAEALRALGMEIARCAPSTSGTLIARGLLQAGREAPGHAGEPPVAQAAALIQAAIAGIQKAGKAEPGDRTMLDALVPVATALRQAADAGATATTDMEPKVGRASWIADRARGHVDGGARVVAIIATAVATTPES
jgi:dihydroxyacetone kinase-like protein